MLSTTKNLTVKDGSFMSVGNVHSVASERQLSPELELLGNHVISSALYDSVERHDPPKCHPHTREVVLKRIREWVDDPANLGRMMWITGAPGVGKSAIAETIAEGYLRAGQLAACCFFSRASSAGRAPGSQKTFLATLAYQLFQAIPEMQDGLLKALKDNPRIFNAIFIHQAKALIVEPLNNAAVRAAARSRPRVVIIDAMDECPEPQGQEHIFETISIRLGFPLVFLVTSRLTDNIQNLTTRLDLDAYNSDSDIEVFLQSKFQEIRQNHPGGYALPTPWPSKEQVDVLVKRACGQFRYATAVIEFVGSLQHPPSYRLEIVLSPLVGAEITSSPLEGLQLQISAANKKHSKSSWFSLSNITK
ncbi:hypothetical protein M413DRAFT_27718 [Hebeloma cylindrosporum]|uniref:Nephrocystin 3-like N-terminal domain-containing protein n=1 Tax=Hebeloma cylindrosporum TaxID=76867 RepID=A0A0C3CCL1_HEBCY|nr:hypothetical protein M413DRAFT_27718 [Hebeloma cylindrosporum h7]